MLILEGDIANIKAQVNLNKNYLGMLDTLFYIEKVRQENTLYTFFQVYFGLDGLDVNPHQKKT